MMDEILGSDYAKFFEEVLERIVKYKPRAIAVLGVTDDDDVQASYYNCNAVTLFGLSEMLKSHGYNFMEGEK